MKNEETKVAKKTEGTNKTASKVQRNYKDTVFRMLFSDKRELLQLYNAVNDTRYENPEELIVTTLENAVYMSVKNDISCVVDMKLNLYEHQSTVNPNIPLRDLDYVSRTYSRLYKDMDIYSARVIRLPNPKFIVFYNGEDVQPAVRKLRLSDVFVHEEENPSLELVVTQININKGYNEELLEKCETLKEYVQYVERVREYQREQSLEEAVNRAVEECIREGILSDFLKRNKAEVISMSIFEYDEKLHEKTLLEIGREEGMQEGLQQGIQQGIQQTVSVLKSLDHTDEVIIQKLMETYHMSGEEAKKLLREN